MNKRQFVKKLTELGAINSGDPGLINRVRYDGPYNRANGGGGWWYQPFNGNREFLGATMEDAVAIADDLANL